MRHTLIIGPAGVSLPIHTTGVDINFVIVRQWICVCVCVWGGGGGGGRVYILNAQ